MKKRLLFAALDLALLVLAGLGALMGAGCRLRPAVN